MKKSAILIVMFLTSYYNYAQEGSAVHSCLSPADAERILGQPAKLIENRSEKKEGLFRLRCTLTTTETDGKTGSTGRIYYMAEEYPTAAAAHDTLAKFKYSNRNMPGWKNLAGIADEAISHSDNSNFQLVIVRRKNKMIRMKVTKLTTSTAPIDTLLLVAQRIVDQL